MMSVILRRSVDMNKLKQLIIKTYDSDYTIIVMIVIGLIALNIK